MDQVQNDQQQPEQPEDNQQQPQAARRDLQPQFVRAPPVFKRGKDDLDLYLKRFNAYCGALNCPEGEKANLLISLLDDRSLGAIERNLTPETTFDQLVERLRIVEGYDNNNSEMYIIELRNKRRARNESIRDFHLDLYRLAMRGWPDNQEVREAMIREQFISGIGHEEIAARLREHPELGNEELLNLAITLHACRRAARTNRSSEAAQNINHIGRQDVEIHNQPIQRISETDRNIETILNMVERMSGQQGSNNAQNNDTYSYRGPKRTPGIQQNYLENNNNMWMRNRQFRPSIPTYRNNGYQQGNTNYQYRNNEYQQRPWYNQQQGRNYRPNWTPNNTWNPNQYQRLNNSNWTPNRTSNWTGNNTWNPNQYQRSNNSNWTSNRTSNWTGNTTWNPNQNQRFSRAPNPPFNRFETPNSQRNQFQRQNYNQQGNNDQRREHATPARTNYYQDNNNNRGNQQSTNTNGPTQTGSQQTLNL